MEKEKRLNYSSRIRITRHKPLKVALLALGFLFTGLGLIGIFIPLLPTTPFLLLAAACFARSSKHFYNWLLNNKLFGKYITSYLDGKGVPVTTKIISVSLLWLTIVISAVFFVSLLWVKILLLLIALAVSVHIIGIPTFRQNGDTHS
jgi:uncharacterized protein